MVCRSSATFASEAEPPRLYSATAACNLALSSCSQDALCQSGGFKASLALILVHASRACHSDAPVLLCSLWSTQHTKPCVVSCHWYQEHPSSGLPSVQESSSTHTKLNQTKIRQICTKFAPVMRLSICLMHPSVFGTLPWVLPALPL